MEPSALVELYVRRAVKLVSLRDTRGRIATRELLEDLMEADRRMAARLEVLGGALDTKFTYAQAKAYQAQIQITVEAVKKKLAGLTDAQVLRAIDNGFSHTVEMVSRLEEMFAGVSEPMRIQEASHMSRIKNGIQSSLLAHKNESIQKYGDAMIRDFERTIRLGFMEGKTTRQITADLIAHGGPGGLFRKKSWMAKRIVRTEVSNAYHESKLVTMQETRQLDFPDMQKKAMATFDNRTAFDSYAVHGQIRDLDDSFEDGAGRRYLRPPGRPNDRETVIPWRPSWKESDFSRMKSSAEIEEAWRAQNAVKDRSKNAKRAAEKRRQHVKRRAEQRRRQRDLRQLVST